MKRVFLLLASAHLAFGQETVVTSFEEANDEGLPMIGIIPVEDYQKATAEIERLQKELNGIQQKQENREQVAAMVLEQKKMVQTLRNQLKAAEQGGEPSDQKSNFAEREKALIEKVDAMENQRAAEMQRLTKRIAQIQVNFAGKETDWERKLIAVEEERDMAVAMVQEYELQREEARQKWVESVERWDMEVEQAVRSARMQEAKKAVANTARLATDWKIEREQLQAQVSELEQKGINNHEAWKKATADWRVEAGVAVRASQMKNAQAAVANTARLAEQWQNERNELEAQVKEISATLAKLEGQLGVQGFQNQQTEVLRLGLKQKSQALEDFGSDAARLATEWRNEREESRRELDALRNLYKSTAKDVKTRDQRVQKLDAALSDKNKALDSLAVEAGKLAESWKEQRGGLQKKIALLEKQLNACQGKLKEAAKKEKNAQAKIKEAAQEKQGFLSQAKNEQQNERQLSAKLAEQLTMATGLQEKLALAKMQEDKLKHGFAQLKDEVSSLKRTMGEYQSQKESDAKEIAALKAELKQVKENYAAAERELASVTAVVKKSKAETAAKDAQVKNLKNQLGRLAVTQQELEGTLIATLGDFEKLQKSYIELKARSADGGETAQKAIAARKVAEAELEKIQLKLRDEEASLRKAQERVKQVEEKKKAAEAAAKKKAEAGKAALGKREAELQKARREMSELQLGQKKLMEEREALRKRFVHIEPVRYQLASANVVAQQQRVLAEAKQVLEVYPDAKFTIKGHTCNIGSEESNLKLSEDRALVLKNFLVENGIEDNRFTLVEGCGDTEPEASNDTEEGRRENRRVEIEVEQ